jgi:putative ABC transport system permease protein
MSAARMRARSDVRARPVSLVLVTLLVGVIGAIAITAFAAARRTDSAYARYRAATNEPDAIVLSCPSGFPLPKVDLAALQRLPEVESSVVALFAFGNVVDDQGRPQFFTAPFDGANIVGLTDPADRAELRPKLLAGRYPTAADEVAVGYGSTEEPRPSIGDTVEIQLITKAAVEQGVSSPPRSNQILRFPVHVTGEILLAGDLTGDQGTIWASLAFMTEASHQAATCDAAALRLKDGLADTPSFFARAYSIAPDAAALDMTQESIFASRTTHLNAIVLELLAVMAALAGTMVLSQSLVRRTSLGAIDTPILRALGMKKREIVWAAAIPALVVAAGGALIAVVGAIVASSSFPTGIARVAEPDPGIGVDAFAIGFGVAVIVVTTVLSVVIPARRLASARSGAQGVVEYRGAERRSAIASWIARLPLPVSAGAGARLALEPGHGRTATPVRSAVVGLTLAVAAMVAAFGFSASMDHFAGTPRLWGVSFEFATGHPFLGSTFQELAVPAFRDDPGVANLEAGNFQQFLSLESPHGRSQEAIWGLETIKGEPVTTTMLEGRWPQTDDEIALGRETLSILGSRVGDTVTASVAGKSRALTIVGVPVFPDFGFGPGLGRGAGMTMDALRVFYPEATLNLVAGDFTPGADPNAVMDRLNNAVLNDLNAPVRGLDTLRLGTTVQGTIRSRTLPLQLSILFAFAAFATLVHVLLTSVRRRRRDLAILQTLGFRRGQVAATVAWQALTLAGMSLFFGVPIGILLGRLGWAAFAYRLGVVSEPVIAPLSIIVIPVTLLVALFISFGPGLAARRVRPAAVLTAE